MKPSLSDPAFDFELLQRADEGHAARNRRALLWLLGLLGLLVGSVIALVLYLQNFEAEEDARQRAADAQWLEQSVQFHFRRLEDDMTALARRTREGKPSTDPEVGLNGGLLWAEPGVLLAHGWLPVQTTDHPPASLARLRTDADLHPDNAQALSTMQDITRGLRRSTYAGPMRLADGKASDAIWIAVPVFDRGEFAGDYLAALSMQRAVKSLVPTWFTDGHAVQLLDNLNATLPSGALAHDPRQYQSHLNLAGMDLSLQVTPLKPAPTTVPRIFFVVALLFLMGMLASLYALRRDFVKRQRVESMLQAQIALRRAMENSVTTGLRAWNLEGQILYVNQAFCRMVGFASAELVGRSAPLPYWPANQMAELQFLHADVIAQGTEESGVEVQFQHRDGQLIDVLVHEAPLLDVDGRQLGWMSSVIEISERKRAERLAARQQERLEASGRLVAVGEAASTLAHELNQPLGALSSFANGLLNRLRSGKITLQDVVPVVERMEGLSEKAGRIIQRVNAFARRREVTRQRLDAAPFLRNILSSRAMLPMERIDVMLPDNPVWVEADALLLEHAVRNVVLNGLHWASCNGTGARVRVSLVTAQGQAGIVVADNGPGVNDEQKDQIFGAFYSATEEGMGMGLAICRSVMEAHHGRIEVDRDPQLGGASFTLWLPLSENHPP
jgi:two-component system sensor histidine kinase DctS